MKIIEKIKLLLKSFYDSNSRFIVLDRFGFYNKTQDDVYLKRKFKVEMGKKLNLENPIFFNEKLQWLKLYNRKPEYTEMVDKYKVREYIKEKIGEEYLIPLLGVYNTPDEINFDELPKQFVLKCNHNSGLGMCICKNKSKLNIKKVKKELKKGLKQNYYLTCREWPYKDVPRKIVCEQFLEGDTENDLKDYKFFCFNGEPLYCQVISNRFSDEKIDFFDMNWIHQNFSGLTTFKNSNEEIKKPITFESMKENAKILSRDIIFARIDFYEANGKLYFGEITFYPAAGFGQFKPDKWNYTLGSYIKLPKK